MKSTLQLYINKFHKLSKHKAFVCISCSGEIHKLNVVELFIYKIGHTERPWHTKDMFWQLQQDPFDPFDWSWHQDKLKRAQYEMSLMVKGLVSPVKEFWPNGN